jgi:DNA polymerase III subunit epsilon
VSGEMNPPRIVVLDVESTGKERLTDQIIELCLLRGIDSHDTRTWRIRPTVPIHPEAMKVHGITAEDLDACPSFAEIAPQFVPLLTEADVIVGYNVSFDIDMLQAELARAQMPPIDLASKQIIDVLRLWHHVEPRTLVAAHAKFCSEVHTDAHQATADVAATARVLVKMLEAFDLTGKAWSEIAAISDPFQGRSAWIGPSAHVQWDESGAVVLGFGKHKGCPVDQADPTFLRWIIGKDFPAHVKNVCSAALALRGRGTKFVDWVSKHYPRPSAQEVLL